MHAIFTQASNFPLSIDMHHACVHAGAVVRIERTLFYFSVVVDLPPARLEIMLVCGHASMYVVPSWL